MICNEPFVAKTGAENYLTCSLGCSTMRGARGEKLSLLKN
jgi:hypothetical protein